MILNIILASALFIAIGRFASNVVGYQGRWWMCWIIGALGIDIGNKIYSIGYWGGPVFGILILLAITGALSIAMAWCLKHDRVIGVWLRRAFEWTKKRITEYKRTH